MNDNELDRKSIFELKGTKIHDVHLRQIGNGLYFVFLGSNDRELFMVQAERIFDPQGFFFKETRELM